MNGKNIYKYQTNMPVLQVLDKMIILPNYDYSEKYWPIISEIAIKIIGEKEVKDAPIVQNVLKECFTKLCSILDQKIAEETRASFYIFCQNFHEDSIEIWRDQVNGLDLSEVGEDFAASRRILKIILEQSCKLDLKGVPVFYDEIQRNLETYTEYLEELLYIGTWSHVLSEYISRSQLFPRSIGVIVKEGKLEILTYQPFPELFKFIFHEMQKSKSDVALSNSIFGFKELLENNFQVNYDALTSFLNQQIQNPSYRYGLVKLNEIIEVIHKEFGYDLDFIKTFFDGLTVNSSNSLSIEECLLKNQHENRHVYRPILEL